MSFSPDWVVHPCVSLIEILEKRDLSAADLAAGLGCDQQAAERLLTMEAVFDEAIAEKLHEMFQVSASFWINRQSHYTRRLAELVKLHEETGKPYYVQTPVGTRLNGVLESKEPVTRDFIEGGRRLACKKCDWMENWWVAYSPRNGEGAVAEGSWADWVGMATEILEVDQKLKAGHPEL